MKVQQCASCGARYNVARLEPGAKFECRRCQTLVTVEERDGRAPSHGLLIAGLLLLAALFLHANPVFGEVRAWPWERVEAAAELGVRIAYGIWAVLAVWAVATALLPRLVWRSVFTAALGAGAVAIATTGGVHGLAMGAHRSLVWMIGVTALLAGLVLVGRGRWGLAPRALAIGGSLALITLAAISFRADGTAILVGLWGDLVAGIQGSLGDDASRSSWYWGVLVALAVVLVAAAGGLLVGLGVRSRALAWILGLILLLGMLIPGAVRFGQGFEAGFDLGRVPEVLSHAAATALVYDGVALWLVVGLAAADLVRRKEGEA